MNQVYLLLGSNIEPEKNIPLAIESLKKQNRLQVIKISSTWRSKSVGSQSDDFLNVAVYITTSCDLFSLKEKVLCEIEHVMGRVRTEDKNAPRTIDLDIVVFNGKILDEEIFNLDHLTLPLAELLPDLYSPYYKCTLSERSAARIPLTQAKKVS